MAVSTRPRAPRLPAHVRREQVLDAALAIAARDGVGAVAMETVAREVGVAKTVVYEAFADRRALVAALLDREHERAMADLLEMIPTARESLEPDALLLVALERFLAALEANPDRWRFLLVPSHGAPPAVRKYFEQARERLLAVLVPTLEWGIARRGGPDLDPRIAAEFALAGGEARARL